MIKAKSSFLFLFFISFTIFSQKDELKSHILFYSSFDGGTTADISVGDSLIYTAPSNKELDQAKSGIHNPNVVIGLGKGLSGDALQFNKKNTTTIFYKAYKNMAYNTKSWNGAVSFWLQLDPTKDLEKGFCDPIQITDVTYNDAALWVDFTKENPRDFCTLAVFRGILPQVAL